MSDSKRLFETATRLIPGGVNSPVRAFRGVGGEPFFVARGEGARIWDVDGRSYLDFLGSWGPLILGHAPPAGGAGICEGARPGASYGAPAPVAGNMGVVAPLPGFLEGLREITRAHGALLIFDEVITGFRLAHGGAQALYGVRPDLTCLGKIIGGGLPVGAYGGARQLMSQVAPLGPVYQAGTLSGNPLAVAAGLATLRELGRHDVFATLQALGSMLQRGLTEGARKVGVALTVNRVGSMLTAFFCDGPVTDYTSAKRADTARYARYFHGMRERGVFLAPSQFEAAFVSLAHTEADIEHAARAAADALASLSR